MQDAAAKIHLTHWDRDKLAAISQTVFWNAFFAVKMFELCFEFYWNMFLIIQLTASISGGNGLAPNSWQTITWTNDDADQWRIYASPGLN